MRAATWDVDPAVLGSWRSLNPVGALVHLADRVDADSAPNEHEVALDVDLLHVDATSFRQIAIACDEDPDRMAARIADIVRERGTLQNPDTGSGGVARGRVTHVGARSRAGVAVGELVIPLVSLIALPLRLDAIGPIDPARPEVPVRGRAIVTGRMPVMRVPADLEAQALSAADVYPVASYVHGRARLGDHVAILGAGLAGLLGAVVAREVVGDSGRVTVVDINAAALARVSEIAPETLTIAADARDAASVAAMLRDAGAPPADLTLACTSARGCEGTALLITADSGTVLFFSTATSFAAAALGSDPLSLGARLELSNGVTPDHGAITLDLLRRHELLRRAFTPGSAP